MATIFEDLFDDATISGGWTQTTTASGSLGETGGNLVITTGEGTVDTDNYNPNGVGQNLDAASIFDYKVKLQCSDLPDISVIKFGLVFKFDGLNHYTGMGFYRSGSSLQYHAFYIESGYTSRQGTVYGIIHSDVVYARINKVGANIKVYYSIDGITWTLKIDHTFGGNGAGDIYIHGNHGSTFSNQATIYSDWFLEKTTYYETVLDVLIIGSTSVAVGSDNISVSDGISFSDVADDHYYYEAVSDGIKFSETINDGTYDSSAADGLNFSDSSLTTCSGFISASDGISFSENISVYGGTYSGTGENYIKTQSGTYTFGSSETDKYLNITEINNLDNTFVLTWWAGQDLNDPHVNCITGYLPSTTQIRFERYGAFFITPEVGYQIVEAIGSSPVFSVQRGETTFASTDVSKDQEIIATTTNRSFIVANARFAVASDSNNEYRICDITAEFVDTDTIRFKRGAHDSKSINVRWEVIEFSEASGVTVQSKEKSCNGDMSAGVTDTIDTTVIKAQTWLHPTFRHEDLGLEQNSIQTVLTNSGTITFQRYDATTDYQSYCRWYAIEFPSDVVVNHYDGSTASTAEGIHTWTTNSGSDDSRFIGTQTQSSDGTGTAMPGHKWYPYFDGSTTAKSERLYTGQMAELAIQVIDVSGWASTAGVIYELSVDDGIEFGTTASGTYSFPSTASDTIDFSDTTTASGSFIVAASDTIELNEDATVVGDVHDSTSDGIKYSDTTSVATTYVTDSTDGIDFSDTSSENITVTFSGSDGIEFSESITNVIIATESISDTIQVSDAVSTTASSVISTTDMVEFGDTASTTYSGFISATDMVEFSDTAGSTYITTADVTDGVILSDTISGSATATASGIDGIEFSEDSYYEIDLETSDTVEFGDGATASGIINTTVSGGLEFSDTSTVDTTSTTSVTDGIEFSENTSVSGSATATSSDTVEFSDTIIPESTTPVIISDGLELSDTTTASGNYAGSISDTVVFSDTIPAVVVVATLSITDGIEFGDTVAAAAAVPINVLDGLELSEIIDITITASGTASDNIDFGDSASGAIEVNTSTQDTIEFSEEVAAVVNSVIDISDGLEFSDSISEEVLLTVSVTDGIRFGDTIPSSEIIVNVQLTDSIDFSDETQVDVTVGVSPTDGITLGEDTDFEKVVSGIATDGITLSDNATKLLTVIRSITDGLKMSDLSTYVVPPGLFRLITKDRTYYFETDSRTNYFITNNRNYYFETD